MSRRLLRVALVASISSACAQVHVLPDADGPAVPTDAALDAAAVAPPDASLRPDAGAPTCGGGDIGSPCATDAECTVHASFSPAFCMPPARGAAAGYCTSICMVDAECGPCGRCVANGAGTSPTPSWYGHCVRACDAASPCTAGYVCAAIEGSRLGCFPDCRLHPGLCGAARCDGATGSCTLGCAADADCSDGSRCVSSRCECGAGTTCMTGTTCGAGGACGCASDAACGPGHTCDPMIGCCRWGDGLCG